MRKNLLIGIISVLVIWLIIISVLCGEGLNKTGDTRVVNEVNVSGFSTDLTSVVEECKSSIVSIEQGSTVSTGFIYKKSDDNVYLLTSFHGVSDSKTCDVYFANGVKASGNIVAKDIFTDIALVECYFPYEVKEASFGDSDLVKDGEFVISIGTAGSLDYDFSTNLGIVSSKYREVDNKISFNDENYDYYLGVIQLSGDFKEGYSGAPVLNMNGQVVGIITMEDDDNVLAITIDEAKVVANKLYENADYTRVNFGLNGKYIADLENYELNSMNVGIEVTYGYYVTNVKINSFASNIGILKGDVITEINGISIEDPSDFVEVIYSSDNEFNISLIRNNEVLNYRGQIYD